MVVGVTGYEPATSSSRTKRATKLRHTPKNSAKTVKGPRTSSTIAPLHVMKRIDVA